MLHSRPSRRSVRLPNHDYRSAARYFVTICASDRACIFGDVIDINCVLSDIGCIVEDEWRKSGALRANVTLDAYVVMPNHLHGIVCIDPPAVSPGTSRQVSGDGRASKVSPASGSLGAIIGQFKAAVSKRVAQLPDAPGVVWQRGYHEHIIRSDADLDRIRLYIVENPSHWADDEENPLNARTSENNRGV